MMQLRYKTYHCQVMSKAFRGLYADIQLLLKDTGMRYPTVACTSEKLHLYLKKSEQSEVSEAPKTYTLKMQNTYYYKGFHSALSQLIIV